MGIMLGNLSVKDIETRLGITLSAEDVAVLQEKRQENVSVPLASGKWHCFDIPFMFLDAFMSPPDILSLRVSMVLITFVDMLFTPRQRPPFPYKPEPQPS